ncbi:MULTISPECIES: helix-turn-helix domain-containing protein [Clostridia]|jgi:transcriptional regulator with XRE-family HTH domain|uniref:helix-turn-helix domain-containing protein n=1 Tax=Clostridia TaxID=186801 RepID=UPI0007406D56|nr:helix-turn-helix transcriptional regulator [Clostridium sp. C105KSO13]CUX27916.1 helix-turn-helix protein [Clostridium sp. C105KSO13]
MAEERINDRFRALRIECNKSQEEMGQILGLSKSGISNIEKGKRKVTKQHLIMLSNWQERKVNINYLETGNGPMFLEPETNDLVARAAALLGTKDPLFEAFIITYSKLTVENREILFDTFKDLSNIIIDLSKKEKQE